MRDGDIPFSSKKGSETKNCIIDCPQMRHRNEPPGMPPLMETHNTNYSRHKGNEGLVLSFIEQKNSSTKPPFSIVLKCGTESNQLGELSRSFRPPHSKLP
ncbi:12229_t:CDS:1 [Acaulospora colombiana]|uniref:12229_t:CDS:1 n=1 Tax=Acaulospora colombiana TaxID=27376 RepID=A0ACA9P6T8_9GLOM|nr:12229_t:CDS:1 [Acaulospora colombiana]